MEDTTMATPRQATLLELVQTISDYAATEDEVVATVAYLVNSGKVLLCGNFAGARIDLSTPAFEGAWVGVKTGRAVGCYK
jgi:hypothetical protein